VAAYWLADSPRGTDMWYGGAIVGWRMWDDKPCGADGPRVSPAWATRR
jgi:hypothetical protein